MWICSPLPGIATSIMSLHLCDMLLLSYSICSLLRTLKSRDRLGNIHAIRANKRQRLVGGHGGDFGMLFCPACCGLGTLFIELSLFAPAPLGDSEQTLGCCLRMLPGSSTGDHGCGLSLCCPAACRISDVVLVPALAQSLHACVQQQLPAQQAPSSDRPATCLAPADRFPCIAVLYALCHGSNARQSW